MVEKTIKILNELGLHARVGVKLVSATRDTDTIATLKFGNQYTSGDNLIGILLLGASYGDTITISTNGSCEEAVMKEIVSILSGDSYK